MTIKTKNRHLLITALFLLSVLSTLADNPFVTHIHTADPSARAYNGKMYVLTSRDVPGCTGDQGINGFCMPGYNMFSTTDFVHWTDHGMVVNQIDVPWGAPDKYGMWAPDWIEKDGKFYMVFPDNTPSGQPWKAIGVAIADQPEGPWVIQPNYIPNVVGIDPALFKDDNGDVYILWGSGDKMSIAKLKDNMMELDGATATIDNMPEGYKEGTYMIKENGKYYYSFAHVGSSGYEIAYAVGDSPIGPFTYKGTVMPNIDNGTNHASMAKYNDQWYLFYHYWSISDDNKLRSVRVEKMYFDGDEIRITPHTERGVGIPQATEKIQVDRYSAKEGVSISILEDNEPIGWKVDEISNNAWIKYNDVDFGSRTYSKILARVASTSDGQIEIRLGSESGKLISTVSIKNTGGFSHWKTISAPIAIQANNINDVVCVFKTNTPNSMALNWIQFTETNTIIVSKSGDGNGIIKINDNVICDELNMTVAFPYESTENYHFTFDTVPYNEFIRWELNGTTVNSIPQLNAGDEVVAVFKYNQPPKQATSVIEAEDFNQQEGIKVEGCNEGGKNIGYVENGDFIKFEDIDFGSGVKEIKVRASSGTSGGTLEVYIDTKNGAPITTVTVESTGDWQKWETFSNETPKISGLHDVYLRFTGGSGYLFNLNWIQFTGIPLGKNNLYKNGSSQIKIYPNPINATHCNFNIDYNGEESIAYQICSIIGSVILNGKLQPGTNSVNCSTFASNGTYVFRDMEGRFQQLIQVIQ